MDFMGFVGDFMGFVGDFMGFLTVFEWDLLVCAIGCSPHRAP
jgi:hypothetical protein